MPTYKRPKGRYLVVVYWQGKRIDRKVTGTKADADAYEATLRLQLQSQGTPEWRTVPRFADFCVGPYRAYAQMHMKRATFRNRLYVWEELIANLGGLRMNEIDALAVEQYQRGRQGKSIRPSTINSEVQALKAILNYGRDVCHLNLAKPVFRSLKVRGKRKVHAWTADEIAQLYAAADRAAPALVPIIVFLANTGCRKGEALALEWENVDFKRRMIRIWPSEEWQPKDDEPREIPMNETLFRWLGRMPREGRFVFPCPGRTSNRLAAAIDKIKVAV